MLASDYKANLRVILVFKGVFMLDEDILYRNYLKDVFEPVDEYYYLNLETKEVVPEYMSSNRVSQTSLDYVYNYTDLMNIKGEVLSNEMVTKVYGESKGLICYQSGDKIFIINLKTEQKIYSRESSRLVTSLEGYHLIETWYGDTASSYEYSLVNPLGEVVFKDSSKDRKEFRLENNRGLIEVSLKNFDGVLYKEEMRLPLGYEEKKESRIRRVFDNSFTKEIKDITEKYNLPEELKKRLNKYDLPYSAKIKVRYNSFFLEIFLVGKLENRYTLVTRSGKVIYDHKISSLIINTGVVALFNDEKVYIPKILSRNEEVFYFDKDGKKISHFVNVNDWLKMDKTFYKVYQDGVLKNFQAKSSSFYNGVPVSFEINGKRYFTSNRYHCNRLLIRDEKGLYGYLDEFGGFAVWPEFLKAYDFVDGIASVKKRGVDGYYGCRINTDGELLSKNECEILTQMNKRYARPYKLIDVFGPLKQIYAIYYQEKGDFFGRDIYFYYDFKDNEIKKSKYELVMQYENYLVCLVKKSFPYQSGYYVMDKRTKKMKYLGSLGTSMGFYEDYFVVEGITYYPADELINLGNFNLTNRILKDGVKLVSQEKFIKTNDLNEDMQKTFAEMMLEDRRKAREKERAELNLRKLEYQRLQEEKEKLDRQKQVVTDKQRHLHIKHMMSVPDDFYIKEKGYYRIAPKYLDSLIDYDLLTVDFTNYLVKGVDFKGTNAAIDPQKVYKKDLSGADLSDVTLLNYDFHGVNIEGTTFTNEFAQTYQEKSLKLTKNKE